MSEMLRFCWAAFLAAAAVTANAQPAANPAAGADKPNILWITADDLSPALGCYGDTYAITPHLDRLASQSVRYTHAFATAPVCSPARSALITGCYAPSLGTHQMRSAFPIPEFMKGFPALLREHGYYTTNNVKTDYNTANWQKIIAASWDESSDAAHWRKRPAKDQPFFSVFNLMTTHQSRAMVWPYDQFVSQVQSHLEPHEIHDPAKAPLPPYYPDTPVVRRTVARFYDCVTLMDKQVGAILKQLEDDGLAEDTIVFFFSDHGTGLPRHKRALLDTGLRVPLLVRVPEKYRHLVSDTPGATDRLVSFVDFGPTVLSLAGVPVPEFMQGQPFLGPQAAAPREYVYGHRDRVDEVRDLTRSVRDRRYLYIRNYMPHLGYNQPTGWPDLGEVRHEFYRLTDPRKMSDAQWHFAGPTRPVEELYDCEQDPMNLKNLAGSPEHRDVLQRMREAHRRHLRESRDLGFIPESEAWSFFFARTTPWQATRAGALGFEPLFTAAENVGIADEPVFREQLTSRIFGVRYWGAIGLAAGKEISLEARRALTVALSDLSPAVRIEAANALARRGDLDPALPVLIEALGHDDVNVALHAARTVELLANPLTSRRNSARIAQATLPAMRALLARADRIAPPDTPPTVVQSGEQDLASFIRLSINAYLSRLPPEAK